MFRNIFKNKTNKKLFLLIVFISISISIWGGIYIYNKRELANFYYEELLINHQSILNLLGQPLDQFDKRLHQLSVQRKEIITEMKKDGFSSLKIKKMDKKAAKESIMKWSKKEK